MVVIERGNPHEPQATALLQASQLLMQSLFPPEDNAYLSIDELCSENVHFFVARNGAMLQGTGALVINKKYGEIKSMFVDPKARRQGIAATILKSLEELAHRTGLKVIQLETGNKLQAALHFYERHGFIISKPFGSYTSNPSSIFMKKLL